MMKLFKNGVGRPSNETLRKRKLFYCGVACCVVILITVGMFMLNHFNVINLMGAAAATKCKFPYNNSKCSKTRNNTVKKAQQLLKSIGFYDDTADGYFGPKTKKAVEKFQRKYKMSADGSMGVATLKKLAEVTGARYYLIRYSKNSGSGNLTNTMTYNGYPTQFIFYDVDENISSTKLSRGTDKHVGWIASSSWKGKSYYYGCQSTYCKADSKTLTWYTSKGSNYHSYMYDVSANVSTTGERGNGEVITFIAQYCKNGTTFDKSRSLCVATQQATTKKTTTTKKITTTKAGNYSSSSSGSYSNVSIVKNSVDPKSFNNNSSYPYTKKGGKDWVSYVKKMSGYLNYVAKASDQYDVDPALIMGIIMVESGANPNAISSAGCVGLMQVNPNYSKYSVKQLKNPEINILDGTRVYKIENYNRHKNEIKSLCGYNQGWNPTSTCTYASKVQEFKKIVKKLYTINY